MKDRSSQNSTKAKAPLGHRLGEGLRTARDVGQEALQDRKALRGRTQIWLKRWLAKLFALRGGGLYAIGYIACFVYFEAMTLAGEMIGSSGVGDFVKSQLIEFIPRFAIESIRNMVKAFMWPVYVVRLDPVYGGIVLGLSFVIYSKFLHAPIEKWLGGNETQRNEEASAN